MGCGDKFPDAEAGDITVGMAVCGEYDLAEMTIGGLRNGHGELGQRMQIVVVDNSPGTPESKSFQSFCERAKCDYFPLASPKGTAAPRDEVFRRSSGIVTCVIDPHVHVPYGSLHHIVGHARSNPKDLGVWFGVMLNDDGLTIQATHMRPEWGSDLMFAKWGKLELKGSDPVEIPMQGLGLVACRTEAWLGSAPGLKGFTCDEWPICEKFRQADRKVLLLPAVKWWHHFRNVQRDGAAPYPNNLDDRFEGYVRWYRHLGKSLDEAIEVYRPKLGDKVDKIVDRVGEVEKFDPSDKSVTDPKPARAKLKLPSLGRIVINYLTAKARHEALGRPEVDEKTYRERLSTCQRCTLLTEQGDCSLCGCRMEAKALWADAECADNPPRWPALVKFADTSGAKREPGLCYHKRVECPRVEVTHEEIKTTDRKTKAVVDIKDHHTVTTHCECVDCGAQLEPAVVKLTYSPRPSKEGKL